MAFRPGTTGLRSAIGGNRFAAWDGLLVLGILIGGGLAARQNGPIAISAPKSAALVKRFAGGLGLGIAASIAAGCTVGQGLTGLGLLAPSSFVVMGAIFGGSTATALIPQCPPLGLDSPLRCTFTRRPQWPEAAYIFAE